MELSVCSTQDGTVTLYFVRPKSVTAENCSKNLKCAFQACRENELGPIWLSTEDCLKMEPTKQDVFIADPFEGEAFDYLLSGAFKCVRVLGPRCLLSCLHEKRPVPELPPPLHNMAMHQLVVTSTGFEKEEKANLQHLVEQMCGIYSNSFHEGITHLIAKVVGSKKYTVAVSKEIPIMTADWVNAVWSSANQDRGQEVTALNEDFFQFTCPVFKGLVICISQLPRVEKDTLKILIEKHGGTYSANLEMSVTSVLITPSSDGDKYKHAVQWRIPSLTQEWIYDSIEQGYSLPMDDYKLLKKKSSTPTHDHSRAIGPPDVSTCSTIMNESMFNRVVDETAASMDHDQSMSIRRVMQNTMDPEIMEGLSSLRDLDLKAQMKTELFLDGCKIFASGFDKSLSEKLRKLFNAGGATRFSSLKENVSHVVVGKYVTDDMNTIEKWNMKPLIVTASWLVACVKEGRLVEETKYLISKSDQMNPPGDLKAMPPPKLARINETNNETFVDDDIVNQYLERDSTSSRRESLDDCSTLPDSQDTQEASGIFKNKVFSVSGYSEENEEQIVELISENGGVVVDLDSSRRPDYSIISVEGEGIVHPKATHCVTHLFIEDCLEQEVLLSVEYFHVPFVWNENLNILDGCVIATSIYKGKERFFITHMSTRMGALYQDMFAKKDNVSRGIKSSTHLLCPSSEGDKYTAAKKWGVPALTKDWLLMCAQEQNRVSENPYLVENSSINSIDEIEVLLNLLRMDKKHKIGTPVNKNLKNLQTEPLAAIVTPDSQTIRKMYPTPGCAVGNDSLDAMPTPSSPYGSTWFPNPSSRTRKGFKRAIDALPDDPVPLKKQRVPLDTPDEVYLRRYTENLKEFIENHPPPKFNSKTEVESKENEPQIPADHHGPLTGVVVYTSKKMLDQQQNLYQTVAALGGDYRWTYDKSVTHFIHVGRQNDTNKEFREARENGCHLVAPDWVWMCRDENRRMEETLFPHTHNPKLSLSIVTTKSNNTKRRGDRSQVSHSGTPTKDETLYEDLEEEVPADKSGECVSKQLEELENLAIARRTSIQRNKSLSDKIRTTPIRQPSDVSSRPVSNTETESQGTGITWDDPQEREARAKLNGALTGETQDIQDQNMLSDAEQSEEVNMSNKSAKDYSFVLSGMTNEEREVYSGIIETLGGCLCENQQSFEPSATHIISSKPNRSEKHLAAIASGKWLLYNSFLDESVELGEFVDENRHEWGNENAICLPNLQPGSTEAKLAAACHKWRLNFLRTGRGAFDQMKVIFFTSKERANSFTRLFEAGGGEVLSQSDYDNPELTHCFIELNKAGRVDLAAFASRQIPCLEPVYLNEYLVNQPPPDLMESCIPEYKKIIFDMTDKAVDDTIAIRRSSRRH